MVIQMFGLGIWDLFFILVNVLVDFSCKFPEIGTDVAKGIQSFHKTVKDSDEIDTTSKKEDKT